MNDELELAVAYWRTMSPQPKAIVYANAIEARLKGIETKDMVIDHELENAIKRGASIARGKGLGVKDKTEKVSSLKGGYVNKGGINPEPSRVVTRPPAPASMKVKRGRKGKAEEA